MNRRSFHQLCLGLSLTAAAFPLTAAASELYEGRILLIRGDQLTLSVGGRDVLFHVLPDSMIFLNGIEVALDDLNAGQWARIDGQQEDSRLVAKMITARLKRCPDRKIV